MIHAISSARHQRELRLFALACVRRVWHLLPKGCRTAVEGSEQFANELIGEADLAAVVNLAEREAQAASPGHRAPDAIAYAASAAVDATSVWPRTAANVLAATSCAASAVAVAAAEADAERYDEIFETTRGAELAAQASL